MSLPRRNFITAAAGGIAAVPFLRFPAGAAEFNYKFATEQPAQHHMTLKLIDAAAKIKAESGGQLEITVFPNSQLGGQTQMMTQVRSGALEFISSGDFILANVVPVAGITAVPFAFSGHKQAWAAMDGPLGAYRRGAIEKIGLYPFARSWDEGFRQTTNSLHPIRTPDDLKGLKIRTPDAPVVTALFRALGASPVAITSAEMYLALQTHLADGMENPITALEAYKIYEVQKYCAFTNHMWTGYTMLANADAYNRLPKNVREIVDRNIDAAAQADNEDLVKLEPTLEGTLKGQGMEFTTVDVDAFRALVRSSGLYAQLRATYGDEAWGLLEKSTGKLAG